MLIQDHVLLSKITVTNWNPHWNSSRGQCQHSSYLLLYTKIEQK